MRNFANIISGVLFIFLLVSCGGGGGGGALAPAGSQSGVFLDSPVAGINYKTETITGQTDDDGRFYYLPGETIIFSVGEVKFPTVTAASTITPLDIAQSDDVNHPVVTNLLVFLQSINSNSDTQGNIKIHASAHSAASTQLDFAVSSSTFRSNPNFQDVVNRSNSTAGGIKSDEDVKAHFKSSLGIKKINIKPIAEAGNSQSVSTGVTVNLSGANSRDANGDALTFSWSISSKPASSSASLTNPTSQSPSFTPDAAGVYTISLTVNDGTYDSRADTVEIIATDRNSAPVSAAIVSSSNVLINTSVSLNGSTSTDANGDPLTYNWFFINKPSNSSASITNSTSVISSFIPDVTGQYAVGLTVNDGKEDSSVFNISISATAPSVSSVVTPIISGTSTSPFTESSLLLTGSLDPNGYVISSLTNTLYDLRWGNLSAPLKLSSTNTDSLILASTGTIQYYVTNLSGQVFQYKIPDNTSFTIPIDSSSIKLVDSWITNDVLNAWGKGITGSGVTVAILDDFTVDQLSEVKSIPFSGACTTINLTAFISTYYCPSSSQLVTTITHGDVVSRIINGKANSAKLALLSNGGYASTSYPIAGLGTMSLVAPFTVKRNTPWFGIAFLASSVRDDYLTHQSNVDGLFAEIKKLSSSADAASLKFQASKVVNLSLGGTSKNPAVNKAVYARDLGYANATNTPDAVFVKAAGNKGCTVSLTNCDPNNAVFYSSVNYKNKSLIVGALTAAGGSIATYSNIAGAYADRFLVADGRGLEGNIGYNEGTSFAAPRVAGYVALIRQKYPHLTAEQVAAVLLATAKWNPAWGDKSASTQAIYGQGEADLAKALSMIGALP